jgi:uncharacterized protein YhaN
MRLNRLELIRYGRFDNAELVFAQPDEGTSDVSIVYGPNEAGKSTAFSAFLELLFGLKRGAHPYAFRFDRANLMVGAELSLPTHGATVLRRSGKTRDSLTDVNGRPFPEATLTSALHGMTRDSYEERFSLNDHALREGGERIAGAQGDLGQLLHAGLSGMTNMSEALNSLSARAEKFHKKGSRTATLATTKKRLDEIKKELRAGELTATREKKLSTAVKKAESTFRDVDERLSQASNREVAAQKARRCYELTASIQQLDEELARYPEGPKLAAGTPETVATLLSRIENQTERLHEATQSVQQSQETIAAHPEDPVAASMAVELKRLDEMTVDGAPLTSRASTAHVDINKHQTDLDETNAELASTLAALQLTDVSASALVMTSEELDTLKAAIEACEEALNDHQQAQEKIELLDQGSDEAPTEPKDLSALQDAQNTWQLYADLSNLEDKVTDATASLTKNEVGLPAAWQALVESGLPPTETLTQAGRDWNEQTTDLKIARENMEHLAAELAQAHAAFDVLKSAPETASLELTEQTRRQRDASWTAHKDKLDASSASAFENAMYADDGARTHYLSGAEARQRLATAQNAVSIAQSRHDTAAENVQKQSKNLGLLSEHCRKLAVALGLQEDDHPASFTDRHAALNQAATSNADLLNKSEALTKAVERQLTAKNALVESAMAVGIDSADANLEVRVTQLIASQKSDKKAWDAWQKKLEIKNELKNQAQEKNSLHAKAQAALDRLTISLPLPDRSPQAVAASLPSLTQLQRLREQQQRIKDVIAQSNSAINAFKDSAQRLATLMGEQVSRADIDAVSTINTARERVKAAAAANRERNLANTLLKRSEQDSRTAETALARATLELAQCFSGQVSGQLGGHTGHNFEELSSQQKISILTERDTKRAERDTAHREREQTPTGVDPILFEDELSRLPNDTRTRELETERNDIQDERDEALKGFNDAKRVYADAMNLEQRSDLVMEQATLREELRDGAREAIVASIGVELANSALRKLAEERRSEMLKDVENDFVTMTAPAWKKVTVWSETGSDKLVGVQEDGRQVAVDNMSTGTMGQLYFALRLAGYRSFVRDPGPLPMILDDIMETFDDTRATAALDLCGQIGNAGQAIMFTHHEHLLTLARKQIPGVNIVEMPTGNPE